MPNYSSDYMRDRGHSCKKSDQGMGKEFIAGAGGVVQGQFVMFSGADDIIILPCTAAGPLIGVAMDTADEGDTVEVQMDGYHWIIVGTAGALIPGDWVDSDANGYARESTCPQAGSSTILGGFILSTPEEDNDCVCLKIQPKVRCEVVR